MFFWRFWWISSKSGQVFLTWILQNLFLEPKIFPWLQCKIFTPEPFPGTNSFPMIAVQNFHSRTLSWNHIFSHDCSARFSLQNPFLEPKNFPWLQCKIFTPEPFPGTNSFPMIAVQNFHSRTLFLEPKKNPMIAVQDFHSRTLSWNQKISHDCSECKIFTPEPFPGTNSFPMIAVQNFHSRTLSWNHIFSHDCSAKFLLQNLFPGTKIFPMIAVHNFHSRALSWNQKKSHDCSARFSLQNPFLEPTIFPWLQCKIFTPEPFPGTNSFPVIAVQDFHSRTLSWNQKFSHDCSAKFSLQNPFLEPKNPMIAVQDFHSRTFSWNPKFSHDCSARFSLKNHFLEPKCFPWLQCKIFTPEPFPGTKHFPMIAVQDFHSRTLSWNHIFSHDCSKVMSQDTVGALPRHSYLQSYVVMNTRHQWLNDSAVSAVIGSSIFSPKSLPNHWLIRGKNCTSTQA